MAFDNAPYGHRQLINGFCFGRHGGIARTRKGGHEKGATVIKQITDAEYVNVGGGHTATESGYGYEPRHARHDKTDFLQDSEIYMSFLGPLQILNDEDNTVGVLGCEQA